MSGSRTTCSYSQVPSGQSLTQSSKPRRKKLVKHAPRKSRSTRAFGSSSKSLQTEYADMVFEEVPFRYNVLASVLSWIVLAGFLVLPTAFPAIEMIMKNSHKINPPPELRFLEKLSLFILGFASCGVGLIGLGCVWYRVGHNYVWLLSSISIPGVFNGASGLISTFVNIYSSQDGIHYNKLIFATIGASGGYAVICGFLTIIYTILKDVVKRRHDRASSKETSGSYRV